MGVLIFLYLFGLQAMHATAFSFPGITRINAGRGPHRCFVAAGPRNRMGRMNVQMLEPASVTGDVLSEISSFAGACIALTAGTLGGTKLIDRIRAFLTASPRVGPAAWRRGVETLPLILGLFYVLVGLAHVTEADALVRPGIGQMLWSFCDEGTSTVFGLAECVGGGGLLVGGARSFLHTFAGIEIEGPGVLRWVSSASALLLALITISITPAIYINIHEHTSSSELHQANLVSQAVMLSLLLQLARDSFFYSWGDQLD